MAKSRLRKKKKPVPPYNHNIALIIFKDKLQALCNMVDCKALDVLNTKDDWALIHRYLYKVDVVKTIVSEYEHTKCHKTFKELPKAIAKRKYIQVKDSKEVISFIELCYVRALKQYLLSYNHSLSPEATELCIAQLDRFYSDDKEWIALIVYAGKFASMLTALPTQPLRFYSVDKDLFGGIGERYIGDIPFKMEVFRPIKEYVRINGQYRPVYQLFLPKFENGNNHLATMNTNSLGNYYKGNQKELPIYMQGHAEQRMHERIFPLSAFELRAGLSLFIYEDKVVQIVGGKLFFDFCIHKIKLGYFVAEIIDEKVIIKTFILITHASAPEGSKFQELTGFSKYDMSFWNIESLSTFIDNDMTKDNPLYTYFEQSNLVNLFGLNNSLVFDVNKEETEFNWDSLSNCLNRYNQRDALSSEELVSLDYSQMLSS